MCTVPYALPFDTLEHQGKGLPMRNRKGRSNAGRQGIDCLERIDGIAITNTVICADPVPEAFDF